MCRMPLSSSSCTIFEAQFRTTASDMLHIVVDRDGDHVGGNATHGNRFGGSARKFHLALGTAATRTDGDTKQRCQHEGSSDARNPNDGTGAVVASDQ